MCSHVGPPSSTSAQQLEPDGTKVELVPGFRAIVLRKAKMQLFHNQAINIFV